MAYYIPEFGGDTSSGNHPNPPRKQRERDWDAKNDEAALDAWEEIEAAE